MTFSISRSSTALSSPAEISPRSRCASACFSGKGRSRLPTWSARKGGVVRWVILFSFRPCRSHLSPRAGRGRFSSGARKSGEGASRYGKTERPPHPARAFGTRHPLPASGERELAPHVVHQLDDHAS